MDREWLAFIHLKNSDSPLFSTLLTIFTEGISPPCNSRSSELILSSLFSALGIGCFQHRFVLIWDTNICWPFWLRGNVYFQIMFMLSAQVAFVLTASHLWNSAIRFYEFILKSFIKSWRTVSHEYLWMSKVSKRMITTSLHHLFRTVDITSHPCLGYLPPPNASRIHLN